MKFVLALCALLFAVQAEAATLRYEFQVKVTEETFYPTPAWTPGDFTNNPGTQTVTYDNDPFGFSYKYSSIRDGQWHDAVIELTPDPYGNGNIFFFSTCSLGGIRCYVTETYKPSGNFLSSPGSYGYFQAYLVDGGGIAEVYDGFINCGTNPQGQNMICGGYQTRFAVRIVNTPLPAGGVLLVSALLMMSRRSRSRRHSLQEQ